jgi:hypothetical protein
VTLGSCSAIYNLALPGNRLDFIPLSANTPAGKLCLIRLPEVARMVPPFEGSLTYPGVMAEMRFEDLNLEGVLSRIPS